MFSEEKRRTLLLSAVLLAISMIATCSTVFLLYRVAVEERREDLIATAQSHARLIEAIARHDEKHESLIQDEFPDYDPAAASLEQVLEAHRNYPGFGKTGEFVLARRSGGQIMFLLNHHHDRMETPEPVSFDSPLAEPIRRALAGQSGTMVGLDYNGDTVLAAYEPVAVLNLGIVAKVDLAEVREPFIAAAGIALLVTLLLILLGMQLLKRVIAPLFTSLRSTSDELSLEMESHRESLTALRESQERFRQIADVVQEVFWLVDCSDPEAPKMLYVNGAFEQIWQRPVADALENPLLWTESIHPEDKAQVVADFFSFLRGEGPFDQEYRILRKDGAISFIWADGKLIRDEQGRISRAAGVAYDITPLKLAEKTVKQANLELEQRVAERTTELNRTIRLMTGREERMAELKKENLQLKARLQQEGEAE